MTGRVLGVGPRSVLDGGPLAGERGPRRMQRHRAGASPADHVASAMEGESAIGAYRRGCGVGCAGRSACAGRWLPGVGPSGRWCDEDVLLEVFLY